MSPGFKRCLRCFRPHKLCFCDSITPISHDTAVLILQHRRERFHPFNTARIVSESLRHCELLVAYNSELAEQFAAKELHDNVGLLYPGATSRLLTELPVHQRPSQLVVIDGTWHQAKTLFRDIPRLHSLPQYRLAPATPGRYRIRREPNEHALSTLEATVAALMAVEPDNTELSRLIETFDRMIEDQIGKSTASWRKNLKRRRGSANIPRVLTGDLSNIVVAYGEREPGKPQPIYWTAIRLGTGERFDCAIESPSLADEALKSHLRLDESVVAAAVSVDEFRERWRVFLRPGDAIAMQHHGTARLLKTVEADFAPTVILKAVNVPMSGDTDSMSSSPMDPSRAAQRLQTAVDYVHRLNSMSQRLAVNATGFINSDDVINNIAAPIAAHD